MSGDELELEGPKGFRSRLHVDRGGANQNVILAGAWPIEFNNVNYDTLGEWLQGAGNWFFRPRRSGYYLIHASLHVIENIPVGTVVHISLRSLVGVTWAEEYMVGDGTNAYYPDVTVIRHLEPTEGFRVYAQPAGVLPWNVDGVIGRTYLCVHRLS
jgi:hypothetical protein